VQHPVTGIDGKSHVLGSHLSISSLLFDPVSAWTR